MTGVNTTSRWNWARRGFDPRPSGPRGRYRLSTTCDFSPGKDIFHLRDMSAEGGTAPVTIRMRDLKFLAFVHDFAGDPRGRSSGPLRLVRRGAGNLVRVTPPARSLLAPLPPTSPVGQGSSCSPQPRTRTRIGSACSVGQPKTLPCCSRKV
jgi:hypothetical protein